VKQQPLKFFSKAIAELMPPLVKVFNLGDDITTASYVPSKETLVSILTDIFTAASFSDATKEQDQSKKLFLESLKSEELKSVRTHLDAIHTRMTGLLSESARLFYEYQNPDGKKKEKERFRSRAASGLGFSKATLRHIAGLEDTSWDQWAKENLILILPLLHPHSELALLEEVTSLLKKQSEHS